MDKFKCKSCKHYYIEGTFCGYNAHKCTEGHDLEYAKSEYYIERGYNCTDYEKREYDLLEHKIKLKQEQDKMKRMKYEKYKRKLNEYLEE